jgi:dephospho-CoA kinase
MEIRFVLIGRAGSGKDTVADYLIEKYGFQKISFAAKLKEIAQEMFPELWKTDKRNLLQSLGMKFREVEENVWVNYVINNLPEGNIVITDCRYENEYEICLWENFFPVKINCDEQARKERLFKRDGRTLTPQEMRHPSEQLNVPCDYQLNNNFAIESLYLQIDKMMQDVASKDEPALSK